jgi:hypothetical protein
MPYIVDFENVSATGLESSPVAEAVLALHYLEHDPFAALRAA